MTLETNSTRPKGRSHRSWLLLLPVLMVASSVGTQAAAPTAPLPMPRFVSETDWIKPPAKWALGEISAVAVDGQDNVWILHRPYTLSPEDKPRSAPPVLKFDKTGKFLLAFGGPSPDYEWPTTEHTLEVDYRGHVWVAGVQRKDRARGDDMVLEFDGKGRFLRQIGRRGASQGNSDTNNLRAPADIFADPATKEIYIADGYANRRVIVFDAATGAFRRMWGAFGGPVPQGDPPAMRVPGEPFTPETGDGPKEFASVHGVEISRDGLVYVSDRNNQRLQVFRRDGTFVTQTFINRNSRSPQTCSGIAFSSDPEQRYLYVADWSNEEVEVYERKTLRLLGRIGGEGSGPGQFRGPHLIATDSKGVLYVAEVNNRRLQRLTPHFDK